MWDSRSKANNSISLKSDFSSVSGRKNLNAEGAPSAPSTTSGGEFSDFGNNHELRSQTLAGSVAPDQETSVVLSGAQQAKREALHGQSSQRKRQDRDRLTLTIIEQARLMSERLEKRISAMENAFEADMGDAWREQIANKVMEPDNVPQRRDGENMEDYRKRLEETLIATMIDPATGAIRPEFADDPETRSYAEWAQAQHQKREVDAYIERRANPALSPVERATLDQQYAKTATFSDALQGAGELRIRGEDDAIIGAAVDDQHLRVERSTGGEAEAFPPPSG